MLSQEFSFLVSGVILGLVAGISPGPILTLVISETIKFNKKAGIKVACVPLLTDIPIVFISILILLNIGQYERILGIIAFLGALFLLYLAWESLKNNQFNLSINSSKTFSLRKGVIANFLSPHPYLFWITVGGPLIFKGYQSGIISPILFVTGFYITLVGSKIIVAILVEKSKTFLNNKYYNIVVKVLGIILIIFAIVFVVEGIKYLTVK
ncbi:MAG: LysE family translocator [Bacteroidales bacterium]|nr:LysE family translocator [Bacteroidales bacterium]